jgi:hypothetical protein
MMPRIHEAYHRNGVQLSMTPALSNRIIPFRFLQQL